MNVGDVFWVEFPSRGGHEQAGRRPAIVLQTAEASARLPTVLLIPLTTRQDALRFPGTLLVEPDAKNGLSRASVALVFQMTVIDKRLLGGCSGRVSDAAIDLIWNALDEIMGRADEIGVS